MPTEGFALPPEHKPENKTEGINAKHGSADLTGDVTKTIGTGKNAQASIVWKTIQWSFLSGIFLTLIYLILTLFGDEPKFDVDTILSLWNLFIPIITLSIGFIFGKYTG